MSNVCALYHIVFSTKNRLMTIDPRSQESLYRFIWKEIELKKSKLIRIGGISNHIHMLVDLHQSISLEDFVRDVKANSSGWCKKSGMFPVFEGWSKGYFAHSIGINDKDSVVEYIKGQVEHHKDKDFENEMIWLYRRAGLVFDNRDFQE